MMLRSGGELTIAHRIQFAPKRLAAHQDAMLLPQPLNQIDKSPAHDAVEVGDRTFFNRLDKCLALAVGQQCLSPLGLPGLQAIWTLLIETVDPSRE